MGEPPGKDFEIAPWGASSHDIARSAFGLFNNRWSHERLRPVSPEFV